MNFQCRKDFIKGEGVPKGREESGELITEEIRENNIYVVNSFGIVFSSLREFEVPLFSFLNSWFLVPHSMDFDSSQN